VGPCVDPIRTATLKWVSVVRSGPTEPMHHPV
jgi:hypothetical protein